MSNIPLVLFPSLLSATSRIRFLQKVTILSYYVL